MAAFLPGSPVEPRSCSAAVSTGQCELGVRSRLGGAGRCRRGLSPAGSSARFSCSRLPGGLMPGEHSPGFGMMDVLASELQHERSVTSFNVAIVPSPEGDLTAGVPSLRSSYSSAGRGCRCGQGRPLGGRACACCGAGSSGNRAALQARWEPLCPGVRGLGSARRACCASLQPGRPARPTVLPVLPP